ncbi:MAG: fibronectin type III domain-containing protein [Verrucomicrobiaceae bacterium]|nr:MAG: fibronectin type III domain-containing protein [Verrucomicrobiaceae bacterium]
MNTQPPVLVEVDGVITVMPGEWSGAPESFSYAWYLNDVLVGEVTGPVFGVSLVAGDRVYARISATNGIGMRTAKSEIFTMPSPVTLALHWTDRSDNEAGFILEWGKDGLAFPNLLQVASGTKNTWLVFPRPGTYYARIKAFNAAGESAYGNTLTIPAQA